MTKRSTFAGLTLTLAAASVFGALQAAEKSEKPERRIVAGLVYPGITIDPEDNISVDLLVKNAGRTDETVLLEVVEKPEGWKAEIKGYSQIVSGVFLEEDKERTLTFSAEPEDKESKKLPSGTFRFAVKAQSADGVLTKMTSLEVTVIEAEQVEEAIELTTSYPVLRGHSDKTFEFSLDVSNESDEDAVFNFRATSPPGWEVSFSPSYEDKQISSLKIEANQSKSVEIEVKPPYNAEAGEFPFLVEVQSPKAKAQTELTVVLTGSYRMALGTSTRLLSAATQPGKQAIVSLLVHNEGSAAQDEISLEALKPENWKVEFEPEKVEGLAPGDTKQVEVTITAAEEALVGDYAVLLRANSERDSKDLELRITVRASTAWAWIGVAIIVVVVLGLSVTFKLLGRR